MRITVAWYPDKPTTPYNCPSLSSVYRSPTIIVTISFRIIQPNGQWLYRRKLRPRFHHPPPPLPGRVAFVPPASPRYEAAAATPRPRLPLAKFPFGTCFAHIEIPFNRNFEWAARTPPILHLQGATRRGGRGKNGLEWIGNLFEENGGTAQIKVHFSFM